MSRFKTELCNNLIELGSCKYGDRCHYAHGAHELRQVSRRHPKYRTESCKNYELTGKCPFGPRCSYVHPKPDLDQMIENLSKYTKLTKAPKPDSEDGEDFIPIKRARETSSSSSSSSSSSPSSSSSSSSSSATTTLSSPSISTFKSCQPMVFFGDENKENQLVVNYQVFKNTTNNLIERPPPLNETTSILKNHQSSPSTVLPFSDNSTTNEGTCSNNILSFDSQSYDSIKKPRLISTINSSSSAASNPFGIRNPLSDYFNNTNINGRSPQHPNKQFYTRF